MSNTASFVKSFRCVKPTNVGSLSDTGCELRITDSKMTPKTKISGRLAKDGRGSRMQVLDGFRRSGSGSEGGVSWKWNLMEGDGNRHCFRPLPRTSTTFAREIRFHLNKHRSDRYAKYVRPAAEEWRLFGILECENITSEDHDPMVHT
jgi:hypothetical protein